MIAIAEEWLVLRLRIEYIFFSFLNANVTTKNFEKFTDINFGEGSKFGTGSKQFSI